MLNQIQIGTTTRKLRCQLTERELAASEEIIAEHDAYIAKLKAERRAAHKAIVKGWQTREVNVVISFDAATNRCRVIRQDTGEVLKTRPPSNEEWAKINAARQVKLDFDAAAAAAAQAPVKKKGCRGKKAGAPVPQAAAS